MRIRMLAMCGAAASLVACGQGDGEAKKLRPRSRPRRRSRATVLQGRRDQGLVGLAGQGWQYHREGQGLPLNSRYKAVLGDPKVSGSTAVVWPSISVNDTGFAAPSGDDWWDVSFAISGSAAVDTVDVKCGKKTFAELKVPPK